MRKKKEKEEKNSQFALETAVVEERRHYESTIRDLPMSISVPHLLLTFICISYFFLSFLVNNISSNCIYIYIYVYIYIHTCIYLLLFLLNYSDPSYLKLYSLSYSFTRLCIIVGFLGKSQFSVMFAYFGCLPNAVFTEFFV